MKIAGRRLFLLLISWVNSAAVLAQPANNQCAAATTLTSQTICSPASGTLLNATADGGTNVCVGVNRPDVWFKFVATSAQQQVTADGGPSVDLVISAFTACGGAMPTGGNCIDATGDDGVETLSLSNLTVGNTYFIRVQDYYGATSAASTFIICVIAPPAVNDQCVNAIALAPQTTCAPTSGTLVNATGGNGANTCIGVDRPDVWYKFVATNTQHQVSADGGASVDLVISAFTACGGAVPNCGNCADATGNDGVEVLSLSNLTVGNTYFIRVQDFYGTTSLAGTFTICALVDPPANDQCAGATTITAQASCTPTLGTLGNATGGNGTNICLGVDRPDVWYKFVATNTQHQVSADGSATVDLVISAFTACGGAVPTGGNCIDVTGDDGIETLSLSNLTVGSTYFIRVQDYYGATSAASTFAICARVTQPLPLSLLSFTGQTQPDANVLRWKVQSDNNAHSYIIERASDGLTWTQIARELNPSQSAATDEYALTDQQPIADAYYRLRSEDMDGSVQYSSVLRLTRSADASEGPRLFPSPATDRLTLRFYAVREGAVSLHAIDMSGRVVRSDIVKTQKGINEVVTIVDGLDAGAYFLRMESQGETDVYLRFVKQ